MKKLGFIFLVMGFMGAGYHYGSQEDTYLHKFFLKPKSRFPANEIARAVQNIWEEGSLKSIDVASIHGKSYAPLNAPEQSICEFYEGVKLFKVSIMADSSISDAAVRLIAEVNCDEAGSSPLFLKSFCAESLFYFRDEHKVENTKFNFENILDGFPKSWYISSAEAHLRDGLSVFGIKPSQSDVKAFGKYTIDCSDL